MRVVWIESTGSTNSYVKESSVPPFTMVCAREQTSGRGQRGNSWESEPGMNLTFSFRMDNVPVRPAEQFVISEAVSLAMVDALAKLGVPAAVKWPNDIYIIGSASTPAVAVPSKIAGILIEISVLGSSVSRAVVGIGLNVNQLVFLSDAPNPVSMAIAAGREFDLDRVAATVAECLEARLGMLVLGSASETAEWSDGLHAEYMHTLWRADGNMHPYRDTATGEEFRGLILGVEPTGHLIMRRSDGDTRRYAFKEIVYM